MIYIYLESIKKKVELEKDEGTSIVTGQDRGWDRSPETRRHSSPFEWLWSNLSKSLNQNVMT